MKDEFHLRTIGVNWPKKEEGKRHVTWLFLPHLLRGIYNPATTNGIHSTITIIIILSVIPSQQQYQYNSRHKYISTSTVQYSSYHEPQWSKQVSAALSISYPLSKFEPLSACHFQPVIIILHHTLPPSNHLHLYLHLHLHHLQICISPIDSRSQKTQSTQSRQFPPLSCPRPSPLTLPSLILSPS